MKRENTYNQPLPFLVQAFIHLLHLVAEVLFPGVSGQSAGSPEDSPYSSPASAGPGVDGQRQEVINAPETGEEGPLSTAAAATVRGASTSKLQAAGKDDHTIYRRVDELPLFLHYEWLSNDMYHEPLAHTRLALTYFVTQTRQYPELARRVGASGRVMVHFVVEKDGSVSHIETRGRLDFGCRQEAARIFEKMNELGLRWEPARIDGRLVRIACQWVVEFPPED